MKKLIVSALTTTVLFSGMITTGYANGVVKETPPTSIVSEKESPFGTNYNQNVKTKEVAKTPLEKVVDEKSSISTRLFSTEFSTLPISEQLSLLNESFKLKEQIHNEYKKMLLSSLANAEIQALRTALLQEQRDMKKEMLLLEEVIMEEKLNNQDSLVASTELLTDTFDSLKAFRLSGRELKETVELKHATLQSTQISVLQQIVTTSIKENQKEKAIDSLSQIVKLSDGDKDYVSFLYELLGEKESYLLFNHELIKMEERFVKQEDSWFISVQQLKNWMDVESTIDENKKQVMKIRHNDHEIVFNEKGIYFNETYIGNPSVWQKDESQKQYIDLLFVFQLLGYKVEFGEKEVVSVRERVYPTEDIDVISSNEIVDSIVSE